MQIATSYVRRVTTIGAIVLLVACSAEKTAPIADSSAARANVIDSSTKTVRTAWIARPDAVGPVRVGTIVGEVARAVQTTARIERIAPGDECGYAYLAAAPNGVKFMLSRDTIVRIDIDSTTVKTLEGAGVGDTEQSVLARYVGRVQVTPHKYEGPKAHYLIVTVANDTLHQMLFETSEQGIVTRYRVGFGSAVALVEGCS